MANPVVTTAGSPSSGPESLDPADAYSSSRVVNPSLGLLTLFGRLARRPKVLRAPFKAPLLQYHFYRAAGKHVHQLMDLIIGSWGDIDCRQR